MIGHSMRFLALFSVCFLTACSTLMPRTGSVSDDQLDGMVNFYDIQLVDGAGDDFAFEPRANLALQQQIEAYEYRVGVGDVISVVVYDHPQLTIPAGGFRSATESGSTVHTDGTIYFPYVGNAKVAGKTVLQIRADLAARLSKYIESPQVDVKVAAFYSQSVYVAGQIQKVGRQPITNIPLTLVQAVSLAGGALPTADLSRVTITRGGEDLVFDLKRLFEQGDLTQNTLLSHGDVVHVPLKQPQQVFVLGEVAQQQSLALNDQAPLSLTQALAESGGLNLLNANARGVFVIRQSQDQGKLIDVHQLDAQNPVAFVAAAQFKLQDQDVVYVTTAPISQWNRILAQLLPSVSAINSLSSTVTNVDKAIKVFGGTNE